MNSSPNWIAIAKMVNDPDMKNFGSSELPLQLHNAVIGLHKKKPDFWEKPAGEIDSMLEQNPAYALVVVKYNDATIATVILAITYAASRPA